MKKKMIWATVVIIVTLLTIVVICDVVVTNSAKSRIFDDADSIPHRQVGVVLGTSPISTITGRRNLYFDTRINAAADLYNKHKVDWLIVSGGDYRHEGGYDEPTAMRDSLIRQGVDSARIILDYNGTRTLNSIAKVKNVYNIDSIILISQKFHNERALYQAKYLGVDAIALNAETPESKRSWLRNRSREYLARVKLFIDVFTGTKPDIKETVQRPLDTETSTMLIFRAHPTRNVNAGVVAVPQIWPCRRGSVASYVTEPKGQR